MRIGAIAHERNPGTAEDRFFGHLDLAFTYLFTAELAVNLLANWYVCLHVYVHVCLYVCIFVCVFVCLYICLSVCIFVCMYAVLPYLFVGRIQIWVIVGALRFLDHMHIILNEEAWRKLRSSSNQ